jgi:hypothetical protein
MTLADSEVFCYVGRAGCCGNLVAVTVDKESLKPYTAREVASWIRQGMVIERVSLETFRGLKMQRCTCRERE